ncbi:MAG: hypothetical protein L0Y58_13140 [Verrucomicrobia subdivision 3 bacterium]|nr:hypothetical protein [Limisphaerales bacterium]
MRLTAERALKPFPRFGRKVAWCGLAYLVRTLLNNAPEKPNLLPVTPAPLAEEQVKAQAQPLRQ